MCLCSVILNLKLLLQTIHVEHISYHITQRNAIMYMNNRHSRSFVLLNDLAWINDKVSVCMYNSYPQAAKMRENYSIG